MHVNAFLADSVVNAEGKLYAQGGGWNVINCSGLPTRHSRVGIGLLIHVPYTATNASHALEICLEDQEGGRVTLGDSPMGLLDAIRGEFNVGRPATIRPGDEQVVPFAVNLDGILFEREDAYSFVIRIDGKEVRRLPFRVNLVKQLGTVVMPPQGRMETEQ